MLEVKKFKSLAPDVRAKSYIAFKKAILAGEISPLEFATKRKIIEETFDLVAGDPEIKAMIIAEIEKYKAEGGATYEGAKLSVVSRAKYDYSKDSTWAAIKAEMEPIEARLKKQEELIKVATKNGSLMTDEESGEVIASPVPAPATDSVTVKLPK